MTTLGQDIAVRRPLTDQLFDEFKRRIRAGELLPGERLPTEKALTIEFKVSRTVIRETVARLSAEGMVRARHGAGVFVSDTARYEAFQITRDEADSYEDVRKLLELRLAVETEMAGLAAERRNEADMVELRRLLAILTDPAIAPEESVSSDAALHASIAAATGNDYFGRFLSFLGVRLVPKRSLVIRRGAAQRDRLMRMLNEEHTSIVEAIEAQDARAARTAARRHLTNSLKRHAQAAKGDEGGDLAAESVVGSLSNTSELTSP